MRPRVTLALDLGTQLGFALRRADGRIESGSECFQPRKLEAPGQRFVRLRRWLLDVKQANPELERVAYERVVGGGPGQMYAAQVWGGLAAVVMHFCEHHQISYEGLGVNTIKKQWTGNGHAKKPEMIARCRELGFSPVDDNEADAIALLHIVCGQVPPLPPKALEKKRTTKPKAAPAPSLGIEPPPF